MRARTGAPCASAAGTRLPPPGCGIGFVFQHYTPFTHMAVAQNFGFGLTVRGRPPDEIARARRVAQLLDLVQLPGMAHRFPAQLSGGQRQRLVPARALAVESEVLLSDEPVGALDGRVRRDLRAWLRRLHDQVKVTTVFVSHDQEEAVAVVDLVVAMNGGRIEQVGTPRDVYDRPASDFVMAFIGAATRLGDRVLRPHDVEVSAEPADGAFEATVRRMVCLGFAARLEMVLGDGATLTAQVSPEDAERLELDRGQIVYVRARGGRLAEGVSM